MPAPCRRLALTTTTLTLAALLAACGSGGSSGESSPTTVSPAGEATVAGSTTATTAASVTTAPATTAATTPTTAAPPTVAPTSPATTSAPTTTSCRAVVHLGDSTSVGLISPSFIPDAEQRMGAQYARVGATESHLEISGARSIVETLPGQVNARDTASALKSAGFDGCWVLALGTTDTANVAVGSNITRMDRIDRMMEVIGDDPVLWVDVKTLVSSGAWSNPEMAKWNDTLAEAQAKYPNIEVYRWSDVVQDAWFSSDRIHYTGEGYAERARLIADALAATYPA